MELRRFRPGRGSARRATLVLAAMLASGAGCARLDRPSDDAPDGAALYRSYCASCHGMDGRGDGPIAPVLLKRPTDLTAIERTEGWYPDALVLMIVDGRYAAHGARGMPVWGTRLTTAELRALTDHLRRIQD